MSLFRTSMRSLQRPAARAFSRHAPQNGVLNAVLRNNAGYVTAIVGAAVVAEFAFGKTTEALFSVLNRGVRMLVCLFVDLCVLDTLVAHLVPMVTLRVCPQVTQSRRVASRGFASLPQRHSIVLRALRKKIKKKKRTRHHHLICLLQINCTVMIGLTETVRAH